MVSTIYVVSVFENDSDIQCAFIDEDKARACAEDLIKEWIANPRDLSASFEKNSDGYSVYCKDGKWICDVLIQSIDLIA